MRIEWRSDRIPVKIQSSFDTNVISIRRRPISLLSNLSVNHGDRCRFLRDRCAEKKDVSRLTVSSVVRYNELMNYLGFVVRSHSLFYCSVPKVATRTLLIFITYLHIRDDLIPFLKSNSTSNSISNSNILNIDYFDRIKLPLVKVNMKKCAFLRV